MKPSQARAIAITFARNVQDAKSERERIEQKEEIFGFLQQSHVSEKNVVRLKTLVVITKPGS